MDHADHHQVQQDIRKTVALSVVLILCISVPASIWIQRQLVTRQKQNDGVFGRQVDLAQFYDIVTKCEAEAQSADSLRFCERMQIVRSFPFARMFYVVGSFLFLGVTLQLNIARVSVLVLILTVLCNFASFFRQLGFAVAGAP